MELRAVLAELVEDARLLRIRNNEASAREVDRVSMSHVRHRSFREVCRWIAVVISFALASGCEWLALEQRKWTEDVLLEDGTTVQIERRVYFKEYNALGGGTYSADLVKSTLKLVDASAPQPEWNYTWIPLVLYKSKESGNWIVVATTSSCDEWWRNGRPIPIYWQYELKNGTWQNTPISAESIGKKTNLFFDYFSDNTPKHVPTDFNRVPPGTVDQYKEIEAIPPAACMNMK
jgi:hypothetical protein